MELTQHVEREGCVFDVTVHTRNVWAHKVLTEMTPEETMTLKLALGQALQDTLDTIAARKGGELVNRR